MLLEALAVVAGALLSSRRSHADPKQDLLDKVKATVAEAERDIEAGQFTSAKRRLFEASEDYWQATGKRPYADSKDPLARRLGGAIHRIPDELF